MRDAPVATGAPKPKRARFAHPRAAADRYRSSSSRRTTGMATRRGTRSSSIVAHRLRDTLRETDMIVRWGGEEFLVFVRATSPDKLAEIAVSRSCAAVAAEPIVYQGNRIRVTASIGYAPMPLPPENITNTRERAIGLADMALYMAVSWDGRNCAYGIRRLRRSDDEAMGADRARSQVRVGHGMVEMQLNCAGRRSAATTAPKRPARHPPLWLETAAAEAAPARLRLRAARAAMCQPGRPSARGAPVHRRVFRAPGDECPDPQQAGDGEPAWGEDAMGGPGAHDRGEAPAAARRAATSAPSAASALPEWPQVTRVTIAISSDDAKPIASACSGPSGSPGKPASWPAASARRPAGSRCRTRRSRCAASRAAGWERLCMKPQRNVSHSISAATGTSTNQVHAVSSIPFANAVGDRRADQRNQQPGRPERVDERHDACREEERDHPVADGDEHGQQETPQAGPFHPPVRGRAEQRERRHHARADAERT